MNDEITVVENPFAQSAISAKPNQPLAMREQSTAVAEVQAALMIARMNPRDEQAAFDRIITTCQRPGLANGAIYSYPKGGTQIEGPSIRLAEAIARAWGNLQCGVRELSTTPGESVMQAFAWDVETNTKIEKVFTVKHERKSGGHTVRLVDDRDVYEKVANYGARRMRSCILALIPSDVVEGAVEQCQLTRRLHIDMSPERVEKMLAAFAGIGVEVLQVEKRIGRRIKAMEPAQFLHLGQIYKSIEDGMSTPGDWFKVEEKAPTGKGTQAAKAAVKGRGKTKPKTEPAPMTDDEKAAAEARDHAEVEAEQQELGT